MNWDAAERNSEDSGSAPRSPMAFGEVVGPAGAPLVLLAHSLGTSAVLWSRVVELLSMRFRVVCWELPGHGDSAPAAVDFTIADLADAIATADLLESDSDFYYAGVSIGGVVGIDLALRYPQRVRAAAIISTGAGVDSPEMWADRASAVRAHGTASLVAASRERWFSPDTLNCHPSRVTEALKALTATDDESYALACEALGNYDARDQLSSIAPPVLAVWGQHDRLVPEQVSMVVADGVARGSAACVTGAAHAAPLEQPEQVAMLLGDFFDSGFTQEVIVRGAPS